MFSTGPQSLTAAAMPCLPNPSAANFRSNSCSATSDSQTIKKDVGRKAEIKHEDALLLSLYPLTSLPVRSALPSLLGYVDNHLLRRRAEWNRPPSRDAMCRACNIVSYSGALQQSTYLPLTCGCWIHYNCFIWHVVGTVPNYDPNFGRPNDCCPICHKRLFVLEGITMLTLATRTNIPMADVQFPGPMDSYYDDYSMAHIYSDHSAYVADCNLIQNLIHFRFMGLFDDQDLRMLTYPDGSPDLRECYYKILEDLDNRGYPRSRWLQFKREGEEKLKTVGFFLFGMLVALKMRSYMIEHHAMIVETEAWADFENSREGLQRLILKDVRGNGWSWASNQLPIAP